MSEEEERREREKKKDCRKINKKHEGKKDKEREANTI